MLQRYLSIINWFPWRLAALIIAHICSTCHKCSLLVFKMGAFQAPQQGPNPRGANFPGQIYRAYCRGEFSASSSTQPFINHSSAIHHLTIHQLTQPTTKQAQTTNQPPANYQLTTRLVLHFPWTRRGTSEQTAGDLWFHRLRGTRQLGRRDPWPSKVRDGWRLICLVVGSLRTLSWTMVGTLGIYLSPINLYNHSNSQPDQITIPY